MRVWWFPWNDEKYLGSTQNWRIYQLLQKTYHWNVGRKNSLKTAAKKFILISFQTCISNWPLKVVFSEKQLFLLIQSTFPWMLLIIYTSPAIFVYPLLKPFDRKNRICKQFSLKLLVRKFLLLKSVQRISRDMLSNHKEERKSAEILSRSTIAIPQLCFLGIFNFNQRTKSCTNANYFWR